MGGEVETEEGWGSVEVEVGAEGEDEGKDGSVERGDLPRLGNLE